MSLKYGQVVNDLDAEEHEDIYRLDDFMMSHQGYKAPDDKFVGKNSQQD